jgi:hypothetical protein
MKKWNLFAGLFFSISIMGLVKQNNVSSVSAKAAAAIMDHYHLNNTQGYIVGAVGTYAGFAIGTYFGGPIGGRVGMFVGGL